MDLGIWYYPHHWPRERWETDVERMVEAGLKWVRTGVYYWSTVEPRRGAFEIDWLDDVLDLYAEHNLRVILGTPTGAPPKWLVDEHPDILQEDPDGTPREFGSRRHYCYNSPTYRREAARIVEKLVDHLADHPAIAGWQIDNEYDYHGTVECHRADCTAAFREWLRDRYGDVETLNERWGTDFWSQRHDAFEEVDPPGPTPTAHHPSRLLDYRRFSSDSIATFNRLQADLIRSIDDWFVTTNFSATGSPVFDISRLDDVLDITASNCYPHHQHGRNPGPDAVRTGDPAAIGLKHDYYRGNGDRPYWLMELQAGDIMSPSPYEPPDGAVRLWAHHATAHGADIANYYRYRRSRTGQEQYWGGLVKHDGSPDRGFREAKQAASELATLDETGPVQTDVAVLYDYDSQFVTNRQSGGADFDYFDHLETYHRAIRDRAVGVDVVPPDRDLERYPVVVVPSLHLVDDETAAVLADYADGGGELVLTARTGVKDRSNRLLNELPPGPLAGVAGARVEQHESRPDALETQVTYAGETYDFRSWGECLAPEGATVVGEHASEAAAGVPAITRHAYGDGTVTYCGVWPGDDLAAALADDVLDRIGVAMSSRLPRGVDAIQRGEHTWVTNFRSDPVAIEAPGDAEWVLGDDRVSGVDLSIVRAPAATLTVVEADTP